MSLSWFCHDFVIILSWFCHVLIVFSHIFGGDVADDVHQQYLEEIIYIPLPHGSVSSSSSSHNYWFLGSTNHCMRHGSDHHSNCWYDWDWKSINLVWGSPEKYEQTLSKQIPIHKIHGMRENKTGGGWTHIVVKTQCSKISKKCNMGSCTIWFIG